jgi:tryptophan synthase alpha chain
MKKHFIAYLTAGDGGIQHTLNAALALIKGGVTMLEIGVPFSDPIADGAVIQRASARALSAKTSLSDILWLAKEIRKISTIPLILFSYLNPLLSVLHSDFFEQAENSGINGLLLVDCPIEESECFRQKCLSHNIDPIYIITPTTPDSRIKKIDSMGKNFLYYACRKGTTGVRTDLPEDFAENINKIKSIVSLPVVAGFGISNRESAREVLKYTDGVVIGSLFVKALEDGLTMDALTKLAQRVNPLELS